MANLTDHNWQQTSKISVQMSPIGTFKIISPLLGNPLFPVLCRKYFRLYLWKNLRPICILSCPTIFEKFPNIFLQCREKKFILWMWSLKPEESEGKNHTSRINVFLVSHTIFFYWKVEELIFFPARGKKNALYDPLVKNRY